MKRNFLSNRYRKLDKNGRIFHVFQHLSGTINLLSSFSVVLEYKRNLKRAGINYPVSVLFYTIMPNHVHLLLETNNPTDLIRFMQCLNGGFAKRICNINKSVSAPLFMGQPSYFPISTTKGFFQCLRYIYRNPFVWNKKHKLFPVKLKDGEYWPSASAQMDGRSFPDFDFARLLEITQMEWAQLKPLLCGSEKDFDHFLGKLEVNPKIEASIFKIDEKETIKEAFTF